MNQEKVMLYIAAIITDLNAALLVGLLAQRGDLDAAMAILYVMKALKGDLQAQLVVSQVAQAVLAQLQLNQATYAKQGSKLNYLRLISGRCPEGYEVAFFKNGGKSIVKGCKKCQKAQEGTEIPLNPITEFKKCGGKAKKMSCGGKLVVKGLDGLNNIPFTRKRIDEYNYTDTKKGKNGKTSLRIVSEDGIIYKGQNGKVDSEGTSIGDSIKGADWMSGREEKVKQANLRLNKKK